jgi:hypothetical protein
LLGESYFRREWVFIFTERGMKRALFITLASLIGVALVVPTAQAAVSVPRDRFFQDLSVNSKVRLPGRIVIVVQYTKNRRGEFTPREAVGYSFQAGAICSPGQSLFAAGGNAISPFAEFHPVVTNGRFSHRFENQAENPSLAAARGELTGTVLKRLKRRGRVTRTARIDGTFNVEDWDPFPGVQENCTTSGSYSATPCKPWLSPRNPNYDRWKRWKVPVCYVDPSP